MECGVSTTIRARPERIWALLTNASEFPKWNSTVLSIEGTIGLDHRIKLRARVAPTRTFKLKVSEFEQPRRMVWREGVAPIFQGIRTFVLSPRDNEFTGFSMVEVLKGLMLPMIAGSLPDFGPSFEQFAEDLKHEAERN